MNKTMMVNRLVNNLLKHEYEVFLSRGAFDIAAKRDKLMLIKSLTNIDGFNPQHATSLRTVSYFVSAHPFVVSMRTNRGFLTDNTIYSRFDIPVVTPKMFENIIEDDAYAASSAKGRHTVEIDADALRKKRYEMKFTLEELGRLVGITKKAMYEIESKRTNPTEKTVKKLERMLKMKLKKTYELKDVEKSTMKANHPLQAKVSKELNRIGVDNSPVQNAPFEIVGKESFSVITGLSKNTKKIKHTAMSVKRLSGIFGSSAFFVSKRTEERSVEGVPVLREDELPSIESTKELKKLIGEKSD
jgi:putative transcriptional regulator